MENLVKYHKILLAMQEIGLEQANIQDLPKIERQITQTLWTSLKKMPRQILEFIDKRQDEGITPTVKEISEALNISSNSVVQWHLNCLEKAGYLTRVPNTARSIRIVKYE